MKLYDLVSLRQNLVSVINADPAIEQLTVLRNNINSIKQAVNNLDSDKIKYINSLVKHYDSVIAKTKQPTIEFIDRLAELDAEILALTRKLFANSYNLESGAETVEKLLAREILLDDDIAELVKNRILLYTSWKYPALEIGCMQGRWTEHLVAADPLYVMAEFQSLLTTTASRFPDTYQRRLRQYLLAKNNLSALPAKQFGFIFSWGHFNYIGLDTATQYLKQIAELLRPGGTFMFSYNDGDTTYGAGIAESFAQSYLPKSLLIPVCLSLGFTITNEFNRGPIAWLEIARPGTLTTVKAHQVLGKILPITY